jgi:hypothetical protein
MCSAMSPGTSSIVVPSIVGPDETPVYHREVSHNSSTADSRSPGLKAPPTPPKTSNKRKYIRPTQKTNEQKSFADIISGNFAKSTFDTQERSYLPEPCIKGHAADSLADGLITRASVEQEFKRAPSYDGYKEQGIDPLIDWVVADASKVFAITVQCHLNAENLLVSMADFYEADFDDKRLPIHDPRAPDLVSDRPPRTEAFSSDIWTEQRHDEFFQFQWTCLAPVFIPDQYEYDLLSRYILPFTRVLDTDPRGGSFSSVFKVVVHPDHQQRHSSPEVSLYSMHSVFH